VNRVCPECNGTNVGEHTSITVDPNEIDHNGDPIIISWLGYPEYEWCYECDKEVRLIDEDKDE